MVMPANRLRVNHCDFVALHSIWIIFQKNGRMGTVIYYSKMAPQSQVIVLILTVIISSIIGCIQLNIAMLSYQADYERMRATLVRPLSIPVARNVAVKRLNKRRRPSTTSKVLVRPGRTNAWCMVWFCQPDCCL